MSGLPLAPPGRHPSLKGEGSMATLRNQDKEEEFKKAQMLCLQCPLASCNEYDPRCLFKKRLREVREAIDRQMQLEKYLKKGRAVRAASTPLGLKKYDKRRKTDTPKRKLWRERKANPQFDRLGRPRKEDTPQRKKWRDYKNRAEVVPANQ